MIVYPAIDIRDGRCVRLLRGDYDRETVYGDDPAAMAQRWIDEGASWLHVVDLDGARAGVPQNQAAVAKIAALGVPVQFGGGIRSIDSAAAILGAGVRRIVLGTVAVEQPDLVREAVERFGDAVAVGVDTRNGMVATRGWFDTTQVSAADLVQAMAGAGVRSFICTDIARDGTLAGPNAELLATLAARDQGEIIASGGIGRAEDLRAVARAGVAGVIVGRAIYEGTVRLADALAIAQEPSC